MGSDFTNWQSEISMEQQIKRKTLYSFISHQNFGFDARRAQVDTVNQPKWVRPFLTKILWDILMTQAKVNLNMIRGIGSFSKKVPFRNSSETMLRKIKFVFLAKNLHK